MLELGRSSSSPSDDGPSPVELLAAAETHWEQLLERCASTAVRRAAKIPAVDALSAAFRAQFADIDVGRLDEDADFLALSPSGAEWCAVADALRGAGALPNDHTAPALLRLRYCSKCLVRFLPLILHFRLEQYLAESQSHWSE